MRTLSAGSTFAWEVPRVAGAAQGHRSLMIFGAVFAGFALMIGLPIFFGGNVKGAELIGFFAFLGLFVGAGLAIFFAGLFVGRGRATVVMNGDTIVYGKRLGPFSMRRILRLDEGGRFKIVSARSRRGALLGARNVEYESALGETTAVATEVSPQDARELAESLAQATGRRWFDTTDESAIDEVLDAVDDQDARLAQRDRQVKLGYDSPRVRWLTLLITGSVITTATIGGVIVFTRAIGKVPIPAWIFGGVFALVGLVIIGAGVYQLLVEKRFEEPELKVSVHPLLLGEDFTVTYRHPVRAKFSHGGATLTLTAEEQAQYRRGTNTYTVTKTIVEQTRELVPAGSVAAGDALTGEATFEVPSSAMHTFEASNNKVLWKLALRVDVPGWPDFRATYACRVLPRVALSAEPAPSEA